MNNPRTVANRNRGNETVIEASECTVELFKLSINWEHALADPISWVTLVRLITAVSVIAVLALL